MAEPREEQIMTAIETALRGMVGDRSWGGRYPNDPRVVGEYLEPGTPAVVWSPTLCVLDSDGATLKAIVSVGAQMGYQHHLPVAVYGYIQGDARNGAGRRTWLNRLWKDHVITLLGDPGVAGIVRSIVPSPEEARVTDEGALEPWGAFRQQWIVTYDETYVVA